MLWLHHSGGPTDYYSPGISSGRPVTLPKHNAESKEATDYPHPHMQEFNSRAFL